MRKTPPDEPELGAEELRFVMEYLKTADGPAAAIACGFAKLQARKKSAQLLSDQRVLSEIARRRSRLALGDILPDSALAFAVARSLQEEKDPYARARIAKVGHDMKINSAALRQKMGLAEEENFFDPNPPE